MKYWNGKGQYQDLFDKHWKNLVPESGRADTAEGNAMRAIAKINYDIFNNGAGNIVNQVEEMDEDDEYYTDYSINPWWNEYFDDIEDFAGLNIDRLKTKILGYVHWDRDEGLSELMDDYIDRIVLRVDNQSIAK
tara:strand:- start:2355 stop:2756 length:402 start_codon:yes stop_codon:yes gene_type:complete